MSAERRSPRHCRPTGHSPSSVNTQHTNVTRRSPRHCRPTSHSPSSVNTQHTHVTRRSPRHCRPTRHSPSSVNTHTSLVTRRASPTKVIGVVQSVLQCNLHCTFVNLSHFVWQSPGNVTYLRRLGVLLEDTEHFRVNANKVYIVIQVIFHGQPWTNARSTTALHGRARSIHSTFVCLWPVANQ